MKLKRDTKFGEESTYRFKIGTMNLTNFDLRARSLKDFHFNELLMSKLCIVLAKKNYRGVIFHETEVG